MKKYNKAGVILLIALCFLCLKTQCTEIQAAEKYKTINLAQQGKQKVGTTEFYANYSNETGRWNVYWKKGKKEGKFGSDQNVSPSIFTNGKIAYYVVEQYDSTISKCVFYKTDLQNGKTNKLFGVNNEEDEYFYTGVDNTKDYEKLVNSITAKEVQDFLAKLLKQNNEIQVIMTVPEENK